MLQDFLNTAGVDMQIGQIVVETANCLTLEDFEAICREHPDLNFEQKATGELVIVSPHGGKASGASMHLGHQLETWMEQGRFDIVLDSNALFLLPDGSKMSPDASVVSRAKWDALEEVEREGFLPLVPDFVIEVRSPSDTLRSQQTKMLDWMSNGVQLGWLLDFKTKKAWVYSESEITEHSLNADLIGAGPMEGFVLSVAKVYRKLG